MPTAPLPVKPKPPATLGQNIRKARERMRLSQLALARLMGHKDDPGCGGSSRVSKWESDQRIPTIETLQRIAEALGVPVGRLLARTNGNGEKK